MADSDDGGAARPQGERRHLEAVAERLLAPLLAKPYSPKSGRRLVGWDAEQGISLFLEGHGRVLLLELDRRDEDFVNGSWREGQGSW